MNTKYYRNGKFDKSEIFSNAWRCVRRLGMSFSSALKMSWSIAKDEKRKELAKTERQEKERNMSPAELAESMGLIY